MKIPKFILDKRKKAKEAFDSLPSPNFRYGLSILMNPQIKLEEVEIKDDFSIDENGISLEEAENYFMNSIKLNDKINVFNAAFFQQALFLRIPKGKEMEFKFEPARDINYTLIIAEPQSKLNFTEFQFTENYYGNTTEIYLREGSEINFFSVNNSKAPHSFVLRKANLARDSRINWYDLHLGSDFTRALTLTSLNGEGSEVRNYGLVLGKEKQQFDLYAEAVHKAKSTKSDMLVKGIVKDRAKALYRGLVRVDKNASNSNGYQKAELLIMNDGAEANAIPNLEIENNEVRCTHGATIGQLDKEKLFYLMSRGLEEEKAKKVMLEGFLSPILDKLNLSLQREIIKQI